MTSTFWRDDAACTLEDAELFDGVDEKREGAQQRIEAAARICRRCPVAARCLSEAKSNRDSGVRGGILLEHGRTRRVPDDRPYKMRRAIEDNPPIEPARARQVDEIAVERIMNGRLRLPLHAKSVDLIEAIRRLSALGYADDVIAFRVGRSKWAVCAARKRHQIPAGAAHNSRKKAA